MKRLALVPALVSCAALQANESAESANDRVNPERPMWVSRPVNALQTTFRRELSAKERTTGEEFEHGQIEVDAKLGRIFVGSADGGLYALRATDGSTLWRFQAAGPVQSEPLYDPESDIVYFGGHDGGLYALRAFDGSLVFRFSSGAEVTRKPSIKGDTLVFGNAADHVFAIHRKTGKQKWQQFRPSAMGMEVAGYAGPTLFGNYVYAAFSDGHVTAYDVQTGEEKWAPVDLSADAEASSTESVRYLDVDTTPVVTGTAEAPVVHVASYAGGVFALDGRTGARLWSNSRAIGVTELTLFEEAAHQGRNGQEVPKTSLLLASSASTGLWALDAQSQGREVWRNKVPDGGITRPVACAGTLALGTSKHGIFLLSPQTGKPIDGMDPGTGFSQVPRAQGSRLFVLSNGGVLFGFEVIGPQRRTAQSFEILR